MTRLTVSTTVNNSLEKVWESFWKSEHIVHWCFASDDWHCPKSISPEPKVWEVFVNIFAAKDGSFSFDFTARYDVVEPLNKLVYTMGEMKEYFLDAGRVVEVMFEETSEGIKITETFDAEDIHPIDMQIAWWTAILENFRKYTETL